MNRGESIEDIDGDEWEVRTIVDTSHPFPVVFGFRVGVRRGTGGVNTASLVLTEPLADFLLSRRADRIEDLDLPLSVSSVKRLRARLGINRLADSRAWWDERADDLASLSVAAFAARHGVPTRTVVAARKRSQDAGRRPNGWYRQPAVAARFLSEPLPGLAREFAISYDHAWWVRAKLTEAAAS